MPSYTVRAQIMAFSVHKMENALKLDLKYIESTRKQEDHYLPLRVRERQKISVLIISWKLKKHCYQFYAFILKLPFMGKSEESGSGGNLVLVVLFLYSKLNLPCFGQIIFFNNDM